MVGWSGQVFKLCFNNASTKTILIAFLKTVLEIYHTIDRSGESYSIKQKYHRLSLFSLFTTASLIAHCAT